jgi:CheY-like chemotaxis protein
LGPAARSTNEKIELPQKTVLVVEDENLLREAVSKMLRKHALTVLEAADGSAALDLVRAQNDYIDLLFLDVTLPGASSREVYELAKRLNPALPVIVTSAKTKEVSTALLATGIENFLRKPYPIADLIRMIQGLLSISSTGR